MEKIIFYLLVVIGVFACSCSQLLLKDSAIKNKGSLARSILNIKVLLSYTIFFGSILINISAFKHGVEVKDIPIIESLGYVFVPILSSLFLNEAISKRTLLSILIILSGVIVFYL